MLPGMNRITVCSVLRKMSGRERIPVLMIAELNDIESIERSFEAGGTDFMTKPINWTILGHRLMYMLRASETFDNLVRSEIKTGHSLTQFLMRCSILTGRANFQILRQRWISIYS
jgi:PleD family two-component response regulator